MAKETHRHWQLSQRGPIVSFAIVNDTYFAVVFKDVTTQDFASYVVLPDRRDDVRS
jgi:hypothetical protein